jgi:hypothetical protein
LTNPKVNRSYIDRNAVTMHNRYAHDAYSRF